MGGGGELSQNSSTSVCKVVPRPSSWSFVDIFEGK